jgi:hypothetical protein
MHCRAHLSSRGLGHRLLGVSPEPVSVPRWVRGQEAAELVKIPGAPAGFEQKVVEADDPGEPGAREPFSASRVIVSFAPSVILAYSSSSSTAGSPLCNHRDSHLIDARRLTTGFVEALNRAELH